jgi:MFS family permease
MNAVFDKIQHSSPKNEREKEESLVIHSAPDVISKDHMTNFIFDRLKEIDAMQQECNANILAQEEKQIKEEEEEVEDVQQQQLESNQMDHVEKMKLMRTYAESECKKAMTLLHKVENKNDRKSVEYGNDVSDNIYRDEFHAKLRVLATEIDTARTIPISVSMLLVGSSVGIIIPVMPYVVSNLGLSAGEFGMVVSSFAFSKLLSNIPAAILVERHGRKPYLVYSLVIISCGVGGIGFATQFEHLVLCRSLTGIGVSLLRTAATLSIADCSTPLNRARSMATMMSSFAAGMSLGPAVGGLLADKIGLNSTFYLVGGIYLAVASINNLLLTETKIVPEKERMFPWHQNTAGRRRRRNRVGNGSEESVFASMQSAVMQWRPLLENSKVRNVVVMNGFYWVALSGAQMTLLPLILTDPSGLALSPTSVGEIYMGMSMVQVFGNPTMAKYIDKIGKVPGIVTGCSILSASMFTLPFCTEMDQVAYTLGFWALGSTMLSTAPTAFISDHVPDDQRAQAIALLRTAGDVGLLVGASSTGAVADMFNMNVAVHSSASLLLLATGWFTARRLADWHQSKHIFK